MLIFLQEFSRCRPFQIFHQFTHRQMGRDGKQKIDMIDWDMAFQYFDLISFTNQPNLVSYPFCDCATQYLFPILSRPHNMDMETIFCMRWGTVNIHPHTLSNYSPRLKARVFLPETDNNSLMANNSRSRSSLSRNRQTSTRKFFLAIACSWIDHSQASIPAIFSWYENADWYCHWRKSSRGCAEMA